MLRPRRTFLTVGVAVALLTTGCAAPQKSRSPKRGYQPPADSLLSQGLEITADSLRVLQQTALNDKEFQVYYVDRGWYQRFLGSSEFSLIEEYDYDILRDFPRGTVFDVVLHLPDSSRLVLAQALTDSLATTNREGYYRCFVDRKKLRMMFLNGINAQAAVFFEKHQD